MKVQIRDRDALESLTAAGLRAYLEANGWSDVGNWGERPIVVYSKEQDARKWEVLVSLRDTSSDYADSMAWAVTTLAEAEDRSQLAVFNDIAASANNIETQSKSGAPVGTPDLWCVRAEKGEYTSKFVNGGYVAAGWLPKHGLAAVKDTKEIHRLFAQEHKDVVGKQKAGWHVGQINAFSLKIGVGDYVITPGEDSSELWYGRIVSKTYQKNNPNDGCPWPSRRKVDWAAQPLDRNELPDPLQKSLMHTQQAVFQIRHREEFLSAVLKTLWPYARLRSRHQT